MIEKIPVESIEVSEVKIPETKTYYLPVIRYNDRDPWCTTFSDILCSTAEDAAQELRTYRGEKKILKLELPL